MTWRQPGESARPPFGCCSRCGRVSLNRASHAPFAAPPRDDREKIQDARGNEQKLSSTLRATAKKTGAHSRIYITLPLAHVVHLLPSPSSKAPSGIDSKPPLSITSCSVPCITPFLACICRSEEICYFQPHYHLRTPIKASATYPGFSTTRQTEWPGGRK